MALGYADREILRPHIVSRCKEAVRKFLLYTQGGGGSPSAGRIAYCTSQMANLDDLAERTSHYVTSEPTFQSDGTGITDVAIQSRIESVLQSFFMPA